MTFVIIWHKFRTSCALVHLSIQMLLKVTESASSFPTCNQSHSTKQQAKSVARDTNFVAQATVQRDVQKDVLVNHTLARIQILDFVNTKQTRKHFTRDTDISSVNIALPELLADFCGVNIASPEHLADINSFNIAFLALNVY